MSKGAIATDNEDRVFLEPEEAISMAAAEIAAAETAASPSARNDSFPSGKKSAGAVELLAMTVSSSKKSAGAVELLAMTVSSGKKSAGAVELLAMTPGKDSRLLEKPRTQG